MIAFDNQTIFEVQLSSVLVLLKKLTSFYLFRLKSIHNDCWLELKEERYTGRYEDGSPSGLRYTDILRFLVRYIDISIEK